MAVVYTGCILNLDSTIHVYNVSQFCRFQLIRKSSGPAKKAFKGEWQIQLLGRARSCHSDERVGARISWTYAHAQTSILSILQRLYCSISNLFFVLFRANHPKYFPDRKKATLTLQHTGVSHRIPRDRHLFLKWSGEGA